MTLKEQYNKEDTWYGKVTIMEIFHLTRFAQNKCWTILDTAKHFECSTGLVSENLKLARAMHIDRNLINCETRQDALDELDGR